MAGPGDELADGRGGLRASDDDREQVIGAVKNAFVQGRLTEDELGARAGRIYAARTYGELAEVIADIPTEIHSARSPRPPWRATRRAWWFEYLVFAPGVVAVILLPGGPHTTIWTFAVLAAVLYPVFWVLGAAKVLIARYVQPASTQPEPLPPCWFDREQATQTLHMAWAQGRLTEDECETRTAEVPGVRSHAELAALTADLPADLAARRPTARDAWTGALATVAAVSVLTVLLVTQPDNVGAFALALLSAATVLLAPPVTVGLMIDARYQKRTGRQLRLGRPRGAAR